MGWLADELSRQLERRRASERSAKQVEKLHEMLTRFLRQHAFSRIHRIRPGEPVLRGPVLGPRFATKKAAPKPPKLGGAAEAPQPAPRIDIEATYQKKNPVAHVLLRPGMYVGSVRLETAERAWWYDASEARMRQSSLAFNPGIVKIFDEILVNACDNKVRDPAMTRIDVTFDVSPDGELTVTVENDGRGIPVALHHDEGIYVPELVLGHLLTGSNFEDSGGAEGAAASGKGTTGGRHGYGAKLTNIFSTSFSVETVDSAARLRYTQCWRNNMGVTEPPIVSPAPARAKDFTRISFRPDLSRFYTEPASAQVLPEQPSAANGGHRIDAGTLLVMRRRVVDAAGVLADGGVRVSLNGEPVVVSSFLEYASLFNPRALPKPVPPLSNSEGSAAPDETLAQSVALLRRIVGPQPLASVPLGRRWDIAIGVAGLDGISDAAAASDANVANLAGVVASFVNGMATPHGGSHASLVLDILSRRLAPQLHKRVSALLVAAASDASPAPSAASVAAAVTPAVVRAHLRLWVHARVADPSFDSQSKERLVTPMRDLLAQLSSLSTAPGSTSDGDIDAAAATTLGLTDRFLKSLVSDLALAETIAASLRARAELESARTLRRAVKALGPASQVRVAAFSLATHSSTSVPLDCRCARSRSSKMQTLPVVGAGMSAL